MTSLHARHSLVFGVVAATGTHVDAFLDELARLLAKHAYEPVPIRLTDLLLEHAVEPGLTWTDEGDRIQKLMDAGDLFRGQARRGDAMALLAALGIQEQRRDRSSARPSAYLIRQLKRPEEISTLRQIYGDRLFVISLYSTYADRLRHLTETREIDPDAAKRLMKRDEEDERKPLGQRTRDTFELGDVFIRVDGPADPSAKQEAERFLDLIFGNPALSPRVHEHAMYLAYAASLRSADLSRQVGAALLNEHGDLIAVGANDVPRPGGGPYRPGAADQRDHALGYDSNALHKLRIARDVFERTQPDKKDDLSAFEAFRAALEGSLLLDITEYGRPVHAEMEALLSCARSGVATRDAQLFSTTFPCHNCAKHIVNAGIMEVQYVEAYPKSMATSLYADAIWEENVALGTTPGGRVVFKHYVGIGPRRYLDLFSLTLGSGRRVKRKDKDGKISPWDRAGAIPRVPSEVSAIEGERLAIEELQIAMR
ncbi:MAG TPA: anti-phage dCTP deaminase [Kofleriaceae bacterium]|jgi:deoxycytidylate deaminase|nr:anti-phage dCTP deaminase [Kofleriaceae bacterium]